MKRKLTLLSVILIIAGVFLVSCNKEEVKTISEDKEVSVLVFISGALSGNPPYENLNNGALEYAKNNSNVKIKTYEAGFNQAEWESQLTSLVATGDYDFVLTTNPSLSEICESIAIKFPNQKFLITDAYHEGNSQIKTYLYNQYQQSFILGHLAALITTSDMEGANEDKKIGFLLAQEFPLITEDILPGFLLGAQDVDPEITLDVRVIGNWYDASKASELTLSMIDQGSDVFTSIAGGTAQGLIKIAQEKGLYVVTYDINSYLQAPNTIVGSGDIKSVKLVQEILEKAINGQIDYGKASIVGLEEGYIDFFTDDPLFKEGLSQKVYNDFMNWYTKVKNGEIIIKKGL